MHANIKQQLSFMRGYDLKALQGTTGFAMIITWLLAAFWRVDGLWGEESLTYAKRRQLPA